MQDEKKVDEIEVTPEMIEAGAEIVGDYDGKFVTAREIAIRAFRAMEAAKEKDGRQASAIVDAVTLPKSEEVFRRLFLEWLDQNQDALEAGGMGIWTRW